MFTRSYDVDKYLLPNFVDLHTAIIMMSSNDYCKNIIKNCKKLEKNHKINNIYNRETLYYLLHDDKAHNIILLVKCGLDLNNKFRYGFTLLINKCYSGDEKYVELLINLGCDINFVSDPGTALHLASYSGNDKCVSLLINNKIKLNEKDINGNTALHDAVRNGHGYCSKLLIEAGADDSIMNNQQLTALNLAKLFNYKECIKLLSDQELGASNLPELFGIM
jgi:ankyrin repeat protein